jgi:hypothetical protein
MGGGVPSAEGGLRMIHVIVTQEDIEKALKDRLRCDCDWPKHCPVALALRRLGYDAEAWPRRIILYRESEGEKLEVPTPEVARNFINEIDNTEYDESLPGGFEFELNDPFE